MKTNQSFPNDRELDQEIDAGRLEAGKILFHLFGGDDGEGQQHNGVLHQYSIAVLDKDPMWKTHLDNVSNNPHAKTLAVVAAARNDPNFPPDIVADLFSTKGNQDPRWFADVFLRGAAGEPR